MRKFYVIGIALLAMFAFSAVAASSASAEGPWWIVSSGTTLAKLEKLAVENILGENDEVPFLLDGLNLVECPEMHILSGAGRNSRLIGNNPGMALAELEFLRCHVENLPRCLAGNAPLGSDTITATVLGVLVYWDNAGTEERTLAMLAFFPDNATTGNDLFAEFELKNESGSTECGIFLNGLNVKVLATGTEVTDAGETGDKELIDKKCGVLAEIGLLNASTLVFEETVNGEEVPVGALNTENTVTAAFILNATLVSPPAPGLIECLLEAFGMASEELGIAKVDLESGHNFGWEN